MNGAPVPAAITFAATALLAGLIAGQAQANTIWHFPY